MSIETPPTADLARLPHLPSVQALRGLGTIGVLVAHLWMIEGKYSPDRLLGDWANLGHWGVDIFFVISGFIMVYVTWHAERGVGAVGPYLWRRVSRIYPLYWIVSLAVLMVWLWRPEIVFSSNRPDILKGFLLFPQKNQPLLAVGWTLVFEMYFYLVFTLALLFARRWIPLFLGVWAVVAVVGWVALAPQAEDAVARHVFNPLTLEFIAGAGFGYWYVKRGGNRDRTRLGRPAWVAGLSVVVVGLLAYTYATQPDLTAYIGLWEERVMLFGVAAFAAFAAMLVSGYRPGRTVVWLGDISYSLYLTHVLTLSLIGRIAQPYLREGLLDNVVVLVVMAAAAIAVGHLTYVWIERPLIRFFRRRRRPARTDPAADPETASASH